MRLFLFSVIMFLHFSLDSIALNIPVNAPHNASSGLIFSQPGAGNFRVNPAYQYSGLETSATYLFGLTELPFYSLHFNKKFHHLGIGLGSTYLDHELYRESVSTLAISYNFSTILVGFAVNYCSENATEFASLSALYFDAGIIWELSAFTTGISIKNFTQTKIDNSPFPVYFLWETNWKYNEKSHLSFGVEKEKDFDFSFKFASLYQVHPLFSLSCGYQFQPNRLGLGANFQVNKYQLSYSFRTHRQLDITHYVTLSYHY